MAVSLSGCGDSGVDNGGGDSETAQTDLTGTWTASLSGTVFSDPGIRFSFLSPALRQVFFIGDGLTETGSGTTQTFTVPEGATRLFLGTADNAEWSDNSGSISVDVSVVTTTATGIDVPGTSNPYLAGMPDGTECCPEFPGAVPDVAPDQSPVLVDGLDFSQGNELTFSASGSVHFGQGCPGEGCSPPDGRVGTDGEPIEFTVPNNHDTGISGVEALTNALLGVFLDDNQPNPPAPNDLSFDPGDVSGETTTLTLMLVQSGTNVSGSQSFSDTLDRSGTVSVTGSISGDMLTYSANDFDPSCDGRTITGTATFTSTTPGSTMIVTISADASGNCTPLSSELTFTKD